MRILIADSDPVPTDIFDSFFSSQGYEVTTADGGLPSIRAARDRVLDVLILAYELPWGGGDDVLKSLRWEFPFTPIDVGRFTGDYSEEGSAQGLGPPLAGACESRTDGAMSYRIFHRRKHNIAAANRRRIAQGDDRSWQESKLKLA